MKLRAVSEFRGGSERVGNVRQKTFPLHFGSAAIESQFLQKNSRARPRAVSGRLRRVAMAPPVSVSCGVRARAQTCPGPGVGIIATHAQFRSADKVAEAVLPDERRISARMA